MTYEDLPWTYRKYSEEQEWDEQSALSRWQAAEDYRGYIVAELLELYGNNAGADLEAPCGIIDRIIMRARGKRAKIV